MRELAVMQPTMIRVSKADIRKLGINWDRTTEPVKPKLRGPNKLEKEYGGWLDGNYHPSGRIILFESIKLRLADKTWYTPDYAVIYDYGKIEFHEVKGFMRDDAAVKLKVAAEQHPWATFILAAKKNGQWTRKVIPRRSTASGE